jgi:hypothetical protein
MPRYIIEREIPGAGALGHAERRAIAARSNEILAAMGDSITWHHSFVTADRIYCVYDADNAALVREHALRGGFPADRVDEILQVIGPATAAGGETSSAVPPDGGGADAEGRIAAAGA